MIRVKKGVVFKAFRPEILELIVAITEISIRGGFDIWITSANDSKHRPNSYHFEDLAIDLRIRNLSEEELKKLIECLHDLGRYIPQNHEYYDVVLEKDHIHIEFDMRRFEGEG